MKTRNKDSPIVYICSPYSGNIARNTELARRYSRLAVERGCVPSHTAPVAAQLPIRRDRTGAGDCH